MRIHKRLIAVLFLGMLMVSTGFGGAIVPGFNSTSDGRNDDGTYTTGGCNNSFDGGTCAGTMVSIGFEINYFGSVHNSLYVNTNGNVTFDVPLPTFTPFELSGAFREIIAPFFADIDTRNPASGVVTFGNGTFEGRNAFGVNWIGVGYFDQQVSNPNSFQLLLVDRSDTGARNFDIIFNYDSILFETGDGSYGIDGLGGYSARAGFAQGTGMPGTSVELPGSGIPGSFINDGTIALITHRLNSDVDGRYIFNARNGGFAVVPEPGTCMLLLGGFVLFLRRRK